MKIKREDVINASDYFPINYCEFIGIVNKSTKRFYSFNGKVFDKQRKMKGLDYSKSICDIEDTDNEGFKYVINTKIISAFPACGKSYFVNEITGFNAVDSDSSEFSWIKDSEGNNTKERNLNFPNNYMEHIKENIGKVDVIFVSSHEVVRKALYDNSIEYYLVYPSMSLKEEYMNRYIKRGNDYGFIKVVEANWCNWIHDIEYETFPKKLKLHSGEYIKDILNKDYCSIYKEFCTVKETNADEYEGNPCCRCNKGYKIL